MTTFKEFVSADINEAGAFSYGAKPPRKGTVVHTAMMKRKEQEKNQKTIEPKDQMVGTAKVVKEEEVELDEAASVSVTVQATAPADKKYAVTEIHPRKSPRGRTRWKDVSYHSSEEEAKTAADAHAKKNNLHRMKSIVAEEVEPLDELKASTVSSYAEKAAKDVKELKPFTKKGQSSIAQRIIDRRKKGLSMAGKRMSEEVELDEKTLTPAELKKREEIAKAMEREKPGMDKSRKMAIATAVAKRVAEQYDDSK